MVKVLISCLATILPAVSASPMYDGVEAWIQLRPLLVKESQRCSALEPFQGPLEDNDYRAIVSMMEHTFTPHGSSPLELLHSHILSHLMRIIYAVAQRRGHYHVREVIESCYESVCQSSFLIAALETILSTGTRPVTAEDILFVHDVVDYETIFNEHVFSSALEKEVHLLNLTFKLRLEATRSFLPKPGVGCYLFGHKKAMTKPMAVAENAVTIQRSKNPTVALCFDSEGGLYAARPTSHVVLHCEVPETHEVREIGSVDVTKCHSLACVPSTGEVVAASTSGVISVLSSKSKHGVRCTFESVPYGVQAMQCLTSDTLLLGSVVCTFDLSTGQTKRVGNAIGWYAQPTADHTHFVMSQPYDKLLELWDISSETCVQVASTHDVITSLAACPHRPSHVVCGMNQGGVALWDTRAKANTTNNALEYHHAHDGAVSGISISHGTIATVGADDRIKLWSVHRRREGWHSHAIEEECVSALSLQHHKALGECLLFASPRQPAHVIRLNLLGSL